MTETAPIPLPDDLATPRRDRASASTRAGIITGGVLFFVSAGLLVWALIVL